MEETRAEEESQGTKDKICPDSISDPSARAQPLDSTPRADPLPHHILPLAKGSRRGTWPIVLTTRMDPAVRKVGEGLYSGRSNRPVKGRVLEVGVAVKQHRGAQGSSQRTYPWSRERKQRETARGTSAYVTCHTARRGMAEAHG